MSLEHAIAAAEGLRAILQAEVRSSQEERRLLRRLDAPGLFTRAADRGAFLVQAQRLERELASQLVGAVASLRVREVTLESLRAASPDGARLADVLAEVRALAGSLRELDRLNHALARRALACVRGYVDAVAPAPRAYDRHGSRSRAAAASVATVSRKV